MDFFGESVYKCHDVLRPYFLPFIFFFFNSPDPPEERSIGRFCIPLQGGGRGELGGVHLSKSERLPFPLT